MSYLIRPTSRGFRVIQELHHDKVKKVLTVPKLAYAELGFRPDMTLEEAKARAKQINAQSQADAGKVVASASRLLSIAKDHALYIDPADELRFLAELEKLYFDNEYRHEINLRYWSACKEVLTTLALDPKDFASQSHAFVKYFIEQRWSHDYVLRITRLLNMWGACVARHRGSHFEKLPRLTSTQTQRIIEAHDGKPGARSAAKPLSWLTLLAAKPAFEEEGMKAQWRWMAIALWFGLRPKEVDGLKDQKLWRVSAQGETKILEVYQTKLTNLPRERRWKSIPIHTEEQKQAYSYICQGIFRRPLNKTLRRLLGEGIETYSPRKGFTDLLLEKGFALEDVSQFLGHHSIEQTWRVYKDKRSFKLPRLG